MSISNNPDDYKFRQVGTKRHPELYGHESMIEPVFTEKFTELDMWRTAETIADLLKSKGFTIPQQFYIWHFVNNLLGMTDTLEEIKWLEWLKFRASMARIFDATHNPDLMKLLYEGEDEK